MITLCTVMQELVPGEMHLRQRHVVEEGDDNATDGHNFIPAYLVKVANDISEVMDDRDDMCFATLWKDSLTERWDNEVRLPCTNFVKHRKDNCLFFDRSNQSIDGFGHEVSSFHQWLH